MLPSILAHEIREGLRSFVITGFETSTPYFKGMFSRFVHEPGRLYKGPYLSIGLPFEPGSAGHGFFPGIRTTHPPYAHQQQAWKRLRSDGEPASSIIATGTGSGKTECFLYPLLDHCLRNPGPGIKAIIIYPMNALANDQAKRFAEIIHARDALRGRVRVGLFVGEGEHTPHRQMGPEQVITDKDAQRASPPDILLTNYKMLDYLLVRPKDRALWAGSGPDTLRYMIVDELHTFDGAQGSDLACLIRRLKARLGIRPGHLLCVGTSATLGSPGERAELVDYCSKIFQEHFAEDGIIGERRLSRTAFLGDALIEHQLLQQDGLGDIVDPDRYATPAAYIGVQYELFFPGEPAGEVTELTWRSALGERLKRHVLFHNLLRLLETQPRSLAELAAELQKTLPAGEPRRWVEPLLDSLCALISWARHPEGGSRPFVQLRLQFWVRELRRMVVRVQPYTAPGTGTQAPALVFADDVKQERGGLYLPLVQCNECHATAWVATRPKGQERVEGDLRAIYNAYFRHSPDTVFLLPVLDEAPGGEGHKRQVCGACGYVQGDDGACQGCGAEALVPVFIPHNLRERRVQGVARLFAEHDCPACGARASMMVFGSRAASLASVAIHHSYATPYNDDKKLIAFSDSVQDAAHRAGFFTARTWLNNVRMAIAQALASRAGEPVALPEFYELLPRYWTDPAINPQGLSDERYVAQFIAPNMLWYPEYQSLMAEGVLPPGSNLVSDVTRRLHWEVLAEFGYRSGIGRSLQRTGTAALGVEAAPVGQAANALSGCLREHVGLRDRSAQDVEHFLWGMILYLRRSGAIYQRLLDAYIRSGGHKYVLNGMSYLPRFAPQTPAPAFPTDAPKPDQLQPIVGRRQRTWFEVWVLRTLGRSTLLPD
jgi:DEAD/DEAH box helicase domain-containing protein